MLDSSIKLLSMFYFSTINYQNFRDKSENFLYRPTRVYRLEETNIDCLYWFYHVCIIIDKKIFSRLPWLLIHSTVGIPYFEFVTDETYHVHLSPSFLYKPPLSFEEKDSFGMSKCLFVICIILFE